MSEDFYGVEITINADGSRTAVACGGYERRAMTKGELRPFVRLAEKQLKREKAEAESACIAA